jgi:hypothetical protein
MMVLPVNLVLLDRRVMMEQLDQLENKDLLDRQVIMELMEKLDQLENKGLLGLLDNKE